MKYTEEEATKFLRRHYKDDRVSATTLGAGEWSQAYSFDWDGRELVLRLGQHVDDFRLDQLAGRYTGIDLPIPRVVDIGHAPGGYFAISERIHGSFIDELGERALRETLPSLFGVLDAIRRVDISNTTGYGPLDEAGLGRFDSWSEYLVSVDRQDPASRVQGWREKLAKSEVGETPFNEAYAALVELAGSLPNVRSLVHNDLLNRNVFVQDGKISGVIDWANALYGDFLYDIAQFTFWSPWYPAMTAINWEAEVREHYDSIGRIVPAFHERLRACHLHMGLSAQTYHAYMGRWDLLKRTADRTLEFLAAS